MKDQELFLGEIVDRVTYKDLTRTPIPMSQARNMWKICGPIAKEVLNKHPMWLVLTLMFCAGLLMGAQARDRIIAKEKEDQDGNG